MHNRKKPEREPTEAETAALREKSKVYKSLVTILWEKRRVKDHSVDTMTVLNKLLVSNPDFYSLWNFRREMLFTFLPDLALLSPGQKLDNPEMRETELTITASAIRRNPKSCKALPTLVRFFHLLLSFPRFLLLLFCADTCLCDNRWRVAPSTVDGGSLPDRFPS